MSARALRSGWSVWLVAALGGAGAVAAVALLFRSPAARPAIVGTAAKGNGSTNSPVPVGLVSGVEGDADKLLKEETMLRDPTPLFLPTRWNAAENALPAADLRREPGSHFQDYAPWLTFAEAELKLNFPPVVAVPARPAEGFATDKPARPFGGFGETDDDVAALPGRNGFVEVTAAGDGRLMLSEALTAAHPPGEGSWQPLEFLVTVDTMGLVRPPVLTESSRVAAVDNYFQDYLGNGLHIGERLPPGFYRICIGP